MFSVDKTTGAVTMHCGDTGAYKVAATRSSGDDFGENDVALYTVREPNTGEAVIEREYALDDDEGLGNGVILIQFHNADTDHLSPGIYSTEIRYVINPYRDSSGKVIDGDIVRTPPEMQSTLQLLGVIREV